MSVAALLTTPNGGPYPLLDVSCNTLTLDNLNVIDYVNSDQGYLINNTYALTMPGTNSACVATNISGNTITDSKLNAVTLCGYGAGSNITGATGGSGNSCFGAFSGGSIVAASGNSCFGYDAGNIPTIGSNNLIMGASAGAGATGSIGNQNTLIGTEAGVGGCGSNNIAIGFDNVFSSSISESMLIGGSLTSPGSHRSLLDYNLLLGAAATDPTSGNLLCYNTNTSELIPTQSPSFPISLSGVNNPSYTGTLTIRGNSPLTLNTRVGYVNFTVATSLAAAEASSVISLTLNNNLCSSSTLYIASVVSTTAGSGGYTNGVTLYSSSVSSSGIVFNIANNGPTLTLTGSNWAVGISFILLQ